MRIPFPVSQSTFNSACHRHNHVGSLNLNLFQNSFRMNLIILKHPFLDEGEEGEPREVQRMLVFFVLFSFSGVQASRSFLPSPSPTLTVCTLFGTALYRTFFKGRNHFLMTKQKTVRTQISSKMAQVTARARTDDLVGHVSKRVTSAVSQLYVSEGRNAGWLRNYLI